MRNVYIFLPMGTILISFIILIAYGIKMRRDLVVLHKPNVFHNIDRVFAYFFIPIALSLAVWIFASIRLKAPIDFDMVQLIFGVLLIIAVSIYLLSIKKQSWSFFGVDSKFHFVILAILNKYNIRYTDGLKIHLVEYNVYLKIDGIKDIDKTGMVGLSYKKSFDPNIERTIANEVEKYYSKKDHEYYKKIVTTSVLYILKGIFIIIAVWVVMLILIKLYYNQFLL